MFCVSFAVGFLVLHSLPVAALGAVGAAVADGVALRCSGRKNKRQPLDSFVLGGFDEFGLIYKIVVFSSV